MPYIISIAILTFLLPAQEGHQLCTINVGKSAHFNFLIFSRSLTNNDRAISVLLWSVKNNIYPVLTYWRHLYTKGVSVDLTSNVQNQSFDHKNSTGTKIRGLFLTVSRNITDTVC